ncbi:NAD(P)-binding domain-containing protein, partial [Synechococcus sp. BA-124 BA4]|uniref:NAD(P)-binding domain-containing protein n=1 Tax=Synechococcus sp. BA-124 BA4 TaxID=3110251 RepID=UPI002B2115F2
MNPSQRTSLVTSSGPPPSDSAVLRVPVVVIGAGQAGLSVASCLQQQGLTPLVLERHRVAHSWQHQRWDSFCLVTPNWQCRLPEFPYDGDDPDGFMGRDAIVDYLRRFAAHAAVPVREGMAVERLQPLDSGGYRLSTSDGLIEAPMASTEIISAMIS